MGGLKQQLAHFHVGGAVAVGLVSSTAWAAPTPPASDAPPVAAVGEIVVTASRREQKLQDLGISITAIGGQALTEMGVKQTTDIVSQVPGLKFNAFSPSVTVFNIRGVSQNAFDDHLEPPVAVYIDDGYVAVMGAAGVPSFDIARVEVLRGPQGTLFGRNATGGLIHFISARPTRTFDGYADVTGGTGGHANGEAALGGPLADNLQFRLAGTYNYRAPYVKNLIGPGIGQENNYAVRAQLAYQPASNVNILVIGRFSRNANESTGSYTSAAAYPDADGLGVFVGPNQNPWGTCNGCDALGYRAPSNPYVINSDTVGKFNRSIYGAQGRIEWDLGAVKIQSITDYQTMHKTQGEDDDGTPNPIFDDFYFQHFHQVSEELKFSGTLPSLRWTAGLYYLDWYSSAGIRLNSYAFYGTPQAPFQSAYDTIVSTRSWSAYAQTEYDILPRVTLIGGLRYVNDRKTDNYHLFDSLGTDFYFNPSTDPILARENYNDYSARAELNYKLDRDVMLYASFNRGIKGPSFSTPLLAPVAAQDLPYGGETLLAYEAGLKSTFLDGHVRLNLGGYIYDYKNYQGYFYINANSFIRNLPARARGLEAELTIVPMTGLTVSGGLSMMNTRVHDVTLPSGRVADTSLPQAPGISGNGVLRYERPVSQRLKVIAQFDMSFTSASYFTMYPSPVNLQPAFALGNVRLSLADREDKWSLAVFSRNLWGTVYRVYANDTSGAGIAAGQYGEPRWVGIELRTHFGR
jgi:iron complex outermembrane recepter protein